MSEEVLLSIAQLLAVVLLAASAISAARDLLGDALARRRERLHLDRLRDRRTPAQPEDFERPLGTVERRLRAAGLRRISPLTCLAASALLVVITFLALRAAFSARSEVAIFGAAVMAYLPWPTLGWWGKRRAQRFETKLVDAVAFMIGALKSGENLNQSFASAGEATEGTVRKEFLAVSSGLDVGMDIRQALQPIDRGYASEGTRLFTRTIIAKWQAGGDLAPVLETVNRVIRDRLRLRWRLHSQMAGARMATTLTAFLPYLLVPFFFWQRPDWVERFQQEPWGLRLILLAVALQLIGLIWIRRVMRIEL